MKIFAISGGRAKGNNEMLLRAALKEAKKICGATIEVARVHDMNLKLCTGCESCMRGLTTGGNGDCVLQGDDLNWLKSKIADADGFILTAPIYDLIPSGSVINLVNRALGVGKDFQTACRANPKVGAVIALGGSDWINFTEPIVDLTLCNLSKSATVVDRLIVGHNPAPSMVVLDDEVMERAKLLGRRVGEALLKRESKEPIEYAGNEGTCPVCHINLIEMKPDGTVGCPYCDARGEFYFEDNKVKIRWNTDTIEKNRFTVWGETEHRKDIGAGHKKAAMNRELINQRKAELEDFGGEIVKPERIRVE